jgi:predicted DsbA family dithiol-disulfide isomerase
MERMEPMEIQVWSDFACPWCVLGLSRLRAARRAFEHGEEVSVVHRSFELNPRAPARVSRSMEEAVAAKYGIGLAQARAGHERMKALGQEAGIDFAFDRVQLGSTFDAHRLAQAARGTPSEDALVEGLFAAYFTEGRLLSDHGVLTDVAVAAGLDAPGVEEILGGSAYAQAVRSDEVAAEEMGVTGVPFFLINGSWPVPGAQDVETMLILLRRAWARSGQ